MTPEAEGVTDPVVPLPASNRTSSWRREYRSGVLVPLWLLLWLLFGVWMRILNRIHKVE